MGLKSAFPEQRIFDLAMHATQTQHDEFFYSNINSISGESV